MAPCKAVFIIEWITMDKKVKMKNEKWKCVTFLKIFIHIRNQSLNSLCTNFEELSCSFNFGHLLHFSCHLDHCCEIIYRIHSTFVTSMFQLGHVPILRQFYAIWFFGHYCHFVRHLDHFGDSIFKIHAHIRNQHDWNRLHTNFETILWNSNFGHLCHFSCCLDHFGDSIFKNHVNAHNQHVWNWHYNDFETILCNINFWSFVPFLCHLDQFGTKFSKIKFIFVISMFEIVSIPILRRFYATSIFSHLCQFMCHLDQFGDSIFQNHVHIRNQHVWNRLCTNFETILWNINFWSFVPLFVPFGPI